MLIEAISSLGIIVPILVLYFKRKDKRIYNWIASYFLLFGLVYTLKFFFNIRRNYIDPFAFPSLHMAMASLLMFFFPNVLSVLFAIFIGETRIILGVHNSIDIIAGFFVASLVFLLSKFESRKLDRQYVHIGLSMLFAFLLFISRIIGITSLLVSLVGYLFIYKYKLAKNLLKYFGRKEFDTGTINLLVGLLIVSVFWPKAWIAAIFLGWVDGLASIFGIKNKRKSLIGFVGGLTGGFIASATAHVNLIFAPIIAFIELISPIDDNLIIPISVWITYFVLSLL